MVVPNLDQGRFLEEALRSLLLQGYPKLRVAVMDGGSRDESAAVMARYAPWLAHAVSGPDGGQAEAINRGLAAVPGELCGWLNADDLLLPGALWRVGAQLAAYPDAPWIAGHGVFLGEGGRGPVRLCEARAFDLDGLLDYGGGHFLAQPSVFFARRLWERVGGLDPALRYALDLDLWLRMRAHAAISVLPVALSLLRQHREAKTFRDNERAMREVRSVVATHARGRTFAVRARALAHMQTRIARGACRAAQESVTPLARVAALGRALCAYPPIAATPAFARAALGGPRPVRPR